MLDAIVDVCNDVIVGAAYEDFFLADLNDPS
jgi:hypothetical protein